VCTGHGAVDTRVAVAPEGKYTRPIANSEIDHCHARGVGIHSSCALIRFHIRRLLSERRDALVSNRRRRRRPAFDVGDVRDVRRRGCKRVHKS